MEIQFPSAVKLEYLTFRNFYTSHITIKQQINNINKGITLNNVNYQLTKSPLHTTYSLLAIDFFIFFFHFIQFAICLRFVVVTCPLLLC